MTFFLSHVYVKHGGEASYYGYQLPGCIRKIPPVLVSVAGTAWGKGCGRVHVLVGHPSGWLQSPWQVTLDMLCIAAPNPRRDPCL